MIHHSNEVCGRHRWGAIQWFDLLNLSRGKSVWMCLEAHQSWHHSQVSLFKGKRKSTQVRYVGSDWKKSSWLKVNFVNFFRLLFLWCSHTSPCHLPSSFSPSLRGRALVRLFGSTSYRFFQRSFLFLLDSTHLSQSPVSVCWGVTSLLVELKLRRLWPCSHGAGGFCPSHPRGWRWSQTLDHNPRSLPQRQMMFDFLSWYWTELDWQTIKSPLSIRWKGERSLNNWN